jgi:glutamate/aspartate transport system substrate-binding protein
VPLIVSVAVTSTASVAVGQTTEGALDGTLLKARTSGEVAVGYRDASIPLSYLSASKEPVGYSIDLCRAIVDAMSTEVSRDLVIKWVPVTSDTRFNAVIRGQVDLECGSTTSNLERKKVVDFSPVIFVAGTKLMVKKGSPVKSYRDLAGRSVVVTTGTTNEKTMRDLVARFNLKTTILTGTDHADSYAQLVQGKADAFATDDVLLYGFIALNRAQDQLMVVGDFLSYEPYGIMFRKDDPQLAKLVATTLHDLAASRELEQTYNKWFMRQLPNGQRLEHADERATRRDDTHHGRRRDDAVNATMILDHVGFNVSDFAASKRFYGAALAPLGIGVAAEGDGWVMLGREGKPQFWFGSFGASPRPDSYCVRGGQPRAGPAVPCGRAESRRHR